MAKSGPNGWSQFKRATSDRRLRTIALVSGEVDTGKTRLGLTGPGPILVQSLDKGMEGVVERILGDPSDPAYSPDKEIYIREYDWNPAKDDFSQDYAIDLREQIKSDFAYGLKNACTILWDKETDIWQVFRYAEFGAPNDAPKNYPRLNQEYFRLINSAKESDVNFFMIQSMKDEWVSEKTVDRNTGQSKTKGVSSGRRVRSGFDRLDELVLMEIHCTYEAGKFWFEIGKSKQNKNLTGETMEAVTLPELGTLIFPDTTVEQWARE